MSGTYYIFIVSKEKVDDFKTLPKSKKWWCIGNGYDEDEDEYCYTYKSIKNFSKLYKLLSNIFDISKDVKVTVQFSTETGDSVFVEYDKDYSLYKIYDTNDELHYHNENWKLTTIKDIRKIKLTKINKLNEKE